MGLRRIFVHVVGDDDHAFRPIRADLARNLGHREAALVALAAGHRHRVIEEDLVGDVDLGIDRPP